MIPKEIKSNLCYDDARGGFFTAATGHTTSYRGVEQSNPLEFFFRKEAKHAWSSCLLKCSIPLKYVSCMDLLAVSWNEPLSHMQGKK